MTSKGGPEGGPGSSPSLQGEGVHAEAQAEVPLALTLVLALVPLFKCL